MCAKLKKKSHVVLDCVFNYYIKISKTKQGSLVDCVLSSAGYIGITSRPQAYSIKRSAPLGNLMYTFCRREEIDITDVDFIFEGKRLMEEHTTYEVTLQLSLSSIVFFFYSNAQVCLYFLYLL